MSYTSGEIQNLLHPNWNYKFAIKSYRAGAGIGLESAIWLSLCLIAEISI